MENHSNDWLILLLQLTIRTILLAITFTDIILLPRVADVCIRLSTRGVMRLASSPVPRHAQPPHDFLRTALVDCGEFPGIVGRQLRSLARSSMQK